MATKRARSPDAGDPLAGRGRRLREARLASGFGTTCAAADAHGWNRNTYASNENGNAGFSHRRAVEYARAFGVWTAWLYEAAGPMLPRIETGRGRASDEAELRAQALAHSADALAALARVAAEGGSDAARVSAANAILDRAHGKAKTAGDPGAGKPRTRIRRIERVVVDPENPHAPGLPAAAGAGEVQERVAVGAKSSRASNRPPN